MRGQLIDDECLNTTDALAYALKAGLLRETGTDHYQTTSGTHASHFPPGRPNELNPAVATLLRVAVEEYLIRERHHFLLSHDDAGFTAMVSALRGGPLQEGVRNRLGGLALINAARVAGVL